MSETLGLKNINMMSKEMYGGLSDVATDELYAISGSGFGFPSDRYDDLELGASGTTYTAPANGYFVISKYATAAGQYVGLYDISSGCGVFNIAQSASSLLELVLPIRKNKSMLCSYTIAGTLQRFRFVYAEGE